MTAGRSREKEERKRRGGETSSGSRPRKGPGQKRTDAVTASRPRESGPPQRPRAAVRHGRPSSISERPPRSGRRARRPLRRPAPSPLQPLLDRHRARSRLPRRCRRRGRADLRMPRRRSLPSRRHSPCVDFADLRQAQRIAPPARLGEVRRSQEWFELCSSHSSGAARPSSRSSITRLNRSPPSVRRQDPKRGSRRRQAGAIETRPRR